MKLHGFIGWNYNFKAFYQIQNFKKVCAILIFRLIYKIRMLLSVCSIKAQFCFERIK